MPDMARRVRLEDISPLRFLLKNVVRGLACHIVVTCQILCLSVVAFMSRERTVQ